MVLHSLEQVVAGKASAERVIWTEDLNNSFENAKKLAAHPHCVAEPRPEDKLSTNSDYSAESRAVGGRLVIHRTQPDGSTRHLIGGFYSAVLDKHKQNWLPCEGEACGIRLVLDHFKHQIRESNHITTHYTDSQPFVLAWMRSKRGAFSTSARISAFLTGISVLPIELQHKPGKDMHTSDSASRHPTKCSEKRCQICSFPHELQDMGDNTLAIRNVTVEDIKSGTSVMPFTQTKTWKNIQMKDPVHCKLLNLINTRQLPEARKTKGDHTKIKLLHNLYTQGKLFVDCGLVMVKTPNGNFKGAAISIPPSIFPGIANELHLRLDHPSKAQLAGLVSRYFYSPGWRTVINDVSNFCPQCASVKRLPKVLLEDTSSQPHSVGSKFAEEIIEREGQKILVLRECATQFTRAKILEDQKADTLRTSLISLVLDLMPDSGTTIRVDGATSFQQLERESLTNESILKKLGIIIVVGRLLNKTRTPWQKTLYRKCTRKFCGTKTLLAL